MSKEVISVHGKDVVVREDTAKAFHGVNWMIVVMFSFVLIVAVVAAVFFLTAGSRGAIQSPAEIENKNAPVR